jgi:hypothetical protein
MADGPRGHVEEANDPSADIAIKLRWTKARRRRPETRADFSPGVITLRGDEWSWAPDEAGAGDKGAKRGRGTSDETELLRRAINTLAYDPSVKTISVPRDILSGARGVAWDHSQGVSHYQRLVIETSDYAWDVGSNASRHPTAMVLTNKGRDRLRNSLNTLKRLGLCGFNKDFVWPAG